MSSYWEESDKFEYLNDYYEVVHLDRIEDIYTAKIKEDINYEWCLIPW